jgi:hypothetical protein
MDTNVVAGAANGDAAVEAELKARLGAGQKCWY